MVPEWFGKWRNVRSLRPAAKGGTQCTSADSGVLMGESRIAERLGLGTSRLKHPWASKPGAASSFTCGVHVPVLAPPPASACFPFLAPPP